MKRAIEDGFVLRPVKESDLPALYQLAKESGAGFTSLPEDEEFLAQKIQLSIESFAAESPREAGESYLFMLINPEDNQAVGCTGIMANVGVKEILYKYKVDQLIKVCRDLNVRKAHQTLTINTDYEGVTEVCTLFLLPKYRGHYHGQLLARSRYLFLAEFLNRFPGKVIAQMRGVSDETGHAPFWDAVGRHFFGVEFPQADHMTGMGEKQFIVDLMPEFRLYTCMLPKAAQHAIGQVHDLTKPALALVEREGFRYRGYIDIFDGGPTVETQLSKVRSIQLNQRTVLSGTKDRPQGATCIVSNTAMDFNVAIATVEVGESGGYLTPAAAEMLSLQPGDALRYLPVDHKTSKLGASS